MAELDQQMIAEKSEEFILFQEIEKASEVVQEVLDVISLETCSLICLGEIDSNSWTYQENQEKCKCLKIPPMFNCKSYFITKNNSQLSLNSPSFYLKSINFTMLDCIGK